MRSRVFVFVLLLLLSSAVRGEEHGRTSFFTAEFARNPDALNAWSLNSDITVFEKAGILFDLEREKLPAGNLNNTATNLAIGSAYDLNDNFSGHAKLKYLSLPDVEAPGAELGVSFTPANWTFGVILARRYYRSAAASRTNRVRADGISEKSGTLAVGYRISSAWSARVTGTGYNYGGATPSELSAVLSSRPGVPAGLIAAVEGFPKKEGTLGLNYIPVEKWDIALSFTRTSYELSSTSTSTTLGVGHPFSENWRVGFSGTSLKQDDARSGVALGLSLTYSWEHLHESAAAENLTAE